MSAAARIGEMSRKNPITSKIGAIALLDQYRDAAVAEMGAGASVCAQVADAGGQVLETIPPPPPGTPAPGWGDGWSVAGVVDPKLALLEPDAPLRPLPCNITRADR